MRRFAGLLLVFSLLLLPGCGPKAGEEDDNHVDAKPVIYLYPTQQTDVAVELDYEGTLTCTYPAYNGGWRVTASPDGTLVNQADGREYSYLYWEGQRDPDYDFSQGFVVRGEEAAAFLQDTLSALGLLPKEYNEFIVYWLPLLQENEYNLISFQREAYTGGAALRVTPQPDSILRVFMACKPLAAPIEIEPQPLPAFERQGLTLVEWGGCMVEP